MNIRTCHIWGLLLILAMAMLATPTASASTARDLIRLRSKKIKLSPFQAVDVAGFKPVTLADLPDFRSEISNQVLKKGEVHTNGLLATINWDQFELEKLPVKALKLNLSAKATGFRKELTVRLLMQKGPAPLAVTLLGFGMGTKDKVALAYQTYLYNAGCHVLSFDSVIRNNMNEVSQHGVAGNYLAEGKICARIIDVTLDYQDKKHAAMRKLTTSVRLIGTSWGGLLAQQILRQPQAKVWPCDRCLILSTPVDIQQASHLLDQYERNDKPYHGILKLAKLLNGYTPKTQPPSDKELSLMRAGLGYIFHGDLVKIAKSNINRYDPNLIDRLKAKEITKEWLAWQKKRKDFMKSRWQSKWERLQQQYPDPKSKAFKNAKKAIEKRHKIEASVYLKKPSEIKKWDFQDFITLLSNPYWSVKKRVRIPSRLDELLKGAPNFVQAFIALDDPLCNKKDIEEIRNRLGTPRLQVIPHGGHLGYSGTKWVQVLIKKYFGK